MKEHGNTNREELQAVAQEITNRAAAIATELAKEENPVALTERQKLDRTKESGRMLGLLDAAAIVKEWRLG